MFKLVHGVRPALFIIAVPSCTCFNTAPCPPTACCSLIPGFEDVYNKEEDFYEKIATGTVPDFDVLVTNPPYSSNHMERIVDFCAALDKPWLMLVPNFVYAKR